MAEERSERAERAIHTHDTVQDLPLVGDDVESALTATWSARGIDVDRLVADLKGTLTPAPGREDTLLDPHPPPRSDTPAPVSALGPTAPDLDEGAGPDPGHTDGADDPFAAHTGSPTTVRERRGAPADVGPGDGRSPEEASGSRGARRGVEPLGFDLDTTTRKLILGEVLGEGGSGLVRLARQPALSRDVAVKVPHLSESDRHLRHLLREARVTGALEHPNIVPVHDLGRDGRGLTMIVMKRIEGTAWSELLARERKEGLTDAFLDKHLGILVQVARAAHFAHSRGVLHRDLKPENVMLGGFGEVYLVDWGIAAALEGCTVDDLPRAADVKDIFGTPAYMAPEMAAGEGRVFSARTDVFLLGAILHDILTGQPPHKSRDLVATLANAYRAAPHTYGPEVPTGLADICRRAMARQPMRRFASAEELVQALEEFRRNRHSLSLCDEGRARLEQLKAVLAARRDEGAQPATLYREARLLFEQAKRIWRDNARADEGMQAAAEVMIAYELSEGRPEAARVLLEDLPGPRPDLVADIERAIERKAAETARLQRLAHEWDPRVGTQARGAGAGLLSVGSVALNVVCALLDRRGVVAIGHLEYAAAHALNLLWAFVIIVILRRSLFANAANRQITVSAIVSIVSHISVMLVSYRLGLGFSAAVAMMVFAMAVMWTVIVLTLERNMWPVPMMGIVELVGVLLWPTRALEVVAIGHAVSLSLTAVLLSRSGARRPREAGVEDPVDRASSPR